MISLLPCKKNNTRLRIHLYGVMCVCMRMSIYLFCCHSVCLYQVIGEIDEFSNAIKTVINNVQLDADLVVSVFETSIRVLG